MDVVIRADGSTQLGSGHVMRCLTLADLLKREGMTVAFVSREMPPSLERLISKNYPLHILAARSVASEEDVLETIRYLNRRGRPEWVIIDNYALGLDWERQVRPYVRRIMVIDDLASRPHDCDLLLDQNFCRNFEARYNGLVPANTRKLLGPKYALLRPEFYEERGRLRPRDGQVRSILISFGGADPTNETAKTLKAMLLLEPSNIRLDIALGGANPHADAVSSLCSGLANAHVHRDANMAELMARADLAIGAPGVTTWERCFLGLPTVAIVFADNQRSVGEAVSSAGAMINLGWHSEVTPQKIANAVAPLLDQPEALREMGRSAFGIMEQNEVAGREELLRAVLHT